MGEGTLPGAIDNGYAEQQENRIFACIHTRGTTHDAWRKTQSDRWIEYPFHSGTDHQRDDVFYRCVDGGPSGSGSLGCHRSGRVHHVADGQCDGGGRYGLLGASGSLYRGQRLCESPAGVPPFTHLWPGVQSVARGCRRGHPQAVALLARRRGRHSRRLLALFPPHLTHVAFHVALPPVVRHAEELGQHADTKRDERGVVCA